MILHKYLNSKYAIEAIMGAKLKVSLPNELNDPFEFLPRDVGIWTKSKVKRYLKDKSRQNRFYEYQKSRGIVKNKKQFKEAMRDIDSLAEDLLSKFQSKEYWDYIQSYKSENTGHIRFISFSSEYANAFDEILMWSHYASNHSGMRIHYDSDLIQLPSFSLNKVEYTKERPQVDHTEESTSAKLLSQLVRAMMTKSEGWEYEKEYRLFVDPDYCDKISSNGKEIYFTQIPQRGLVRIDVGLNCDEKYIKDLEILSKSNLFNNIKYFKTELNKDQYKLDYQPLF